MPGQVGDRGTRGPGRDQGAVGLQSVRRYRVLEPGEELGAVEAEGVSEQDFGVEPGRVEAGGRQRVLTVANRLADGRGWRV
jgi:hypothetical protein